MDEGGGGRGENVIGCSTRGSSQPIKSRCLFCWQRTGSEWPLVGYSSTETKEGHVQAVAGTEPLPVSHQPHLQPAPMTRKSDGCGLATTVSAEYVFYAQVAHFTHVFSLVWKAKNRLCLSSHTVSVSLSLSLAPPPPLSLLVLIKWRIKNQTKQERELSRSFLCINNREQQQWIQAAPRPDSTDHRHCFALHTGYTAHIHVKHAPEHKDRPVNTWKSSKWMILLPFLGVFCRKLSEGWCGGDVQAEGMLTLAPPDHRATCFNIHDITSSAGRAARRRGCTQHTALIGRRQDAHTRTHTRGRARAHTHTHTNSLSKMIACSYCHSPCL